MAVKPDGPEGGFVGLLIIASLLSLAVVALSHEEPGVGTQQAATEDEKSEDVFQNDKAQMSVTEEQRNLPVQSCADMTPGNEKVKELCQEDFGQSELDDEDELTSSSCKGCEAGHPLEFEEEKARYLEKCTTHEKRQVESLEQVSEPDKDSEFSGSIIQRSIQGLEDVLDQVEKSGVKVFEKLGGVMDQVGLSRKHMMKRLDTVMDRMSESVSESKVRVIQSLDSLMDHVSASKTKMLEEIDHVIDKVAHSKVIEEIRALPGEIRESFVLSVRNRSYVAAGVMVAITTAILVAGAVYFAWCHQDAWSYHSLSPESPAAVQGHVNSTARGNYEAAVNRSATAHGFKHISNGHTAAGGDGYHADDDDDDNTNPLGEDSCWVASGSPGTKDSDGMGEVRDVDLHNVPLPVSGVDLHNVPLPVSDVDLHSVPLPVSDVDLHNVPLEDPDVVLQLSFVSSCSEVAIKPGLEDTRDSGDVHEVPFIEIPKEDIPHKCQQKGMAFRDDHQKSIPNTSMPNTNEHQTDSAVEYLLSRDTSHILASADVLCAFQSKRDDVVGCVESTDHQLGSPFSGLGLDNAGGVAQSDTASLSVPNTGFSNIPNTGSSSIPNTGSSSIPNTGSSSIPNTGFLNIPNTGSSSIPNTGSSSIPNTASLSIPNTGSSSIPNTGSSSIPNTASLSIPNTGSSSIPNTGSLSIPNTASSSIPNTGSLSIPNTGSSSIPNTASLSIPNTGSSSIPNTGSLSIPNTASSSIPNTGSLSIPNTGSSSIPNTGSSSIPNTGSLSIPKTGSSSIPNTGSLSIPNTGSPSIPNTGSSSIPNTGSLSIPNTASLSIPNTASLSIPNTDGMRNNDPVAKVTG